MKEDLYAGITIPIYVLQKSGNPEHIFLLRQEFENRNEFDLQADDEYNGDLDFQKESWRAFMRILEKAEARNDDFIAICGEHHRFTDSYSKNKLFNNIVAAASQGTKLLLGGVSKFGHAVIVDEERCWIDSFQDSQFFIIYRSLFKLILDEPFEDGDEFFQKLSLLTGNKMLIFPFISTYRDFSEGHKRDIEKESRLSELSQQSIKRLEKMRHINRKYQSNL
ncbi:hypothetical protein [Olivibacter domesticus]|uniref:Uncharacterized protein n=1 Tax=Olivibacter domesticus TaxID=407022 RepID=A0A1H7JQP7_OLID1|nr:hypothetical protein [Olivibacter domesticus]SEK76724.1 hypothetical protein SAMN05661044_01094 [Olivibacter domesticus]